MLSLLSPHETPPKKCCILCYSVIKKNTFQSVLMRWMNLEPIIQNEVNQKKKDKYCILFAYGMHAYGI